jgi:predicted nucleic-acid-binding protein
MIGLDVNVLVRFVTPHDAEAENVAAGIAHAKTQGIRLCINDLVLTEMVRVLRTVYDKDPEGHRSGGRSFTREFALRVRRQTGVTEALRDFTDSAVADFTNCLNRRKNLRRVAPEHFRSTDC